MTISGFRSLACSVFYGKSSTQRSYPSSTCNVSWQSQAKFQDNLSSTSFQAILSCQRFMAISDLSVNIKLGGLNQLVFRGDFVSQRSCIASVSWQSQFSVILPNQCFMVTSVLSISKQSFPSLCFKAISVLRVFTYQLFHGHLSSLWSNLAGISRQSQFSVVLASQYFKAISVLCGLSQPVFQGDLSSLWSNLASISRQSQFSMVLTSRRCITI